LESKNAADLSAEFNSRIAAIDPGRIHADASQRLTSSVEDRNVEEVLKIYDNKGLLGQAATLFGMASKGLQEHIGRMLRSSQGKVFQDAVRAKLPVLNAAPTTIDAPEVAAVTK
jgi:hypothetical protein